MKIFFFHNPKAAGTAVSHMLNTIAQGCRKCPKIENNLVEHLALDGNYSPFKGYDVYDGHYGRDIFEVVNDGHVQITNFRDPISRIASVYNYFRFSIFLDSRSLRSDAFFAVNAAKHLTFDEFVLSQDPRINVYISDQHFRQLTTSCWSPVPEGSLGDAFSLIDKMPFYYIVEYPELSARWAHKVFDVEAKPLPYLNMTQGVRDEMISAASMSDRSFQIVSEKNQRDFILYQYAVNRLHERISNTRPNTFYAPDTRRSVA